MPKRAALARRGPLEGLARAGLLLLRCVLLMHRAVEDLQPGLHLFTHAHVEVGLRGLDGGVRVGARECAWVGVRGCACARECGWVVVVVRVRVRVSVSVSGWVGGCACACECGWLGGWVSTPSKSDLDVVLEVVTEAREQSDRLVELGVR